MGRHPSRTNAGARRCAQSILGEERVTLVLACRDHANTPSQLWISPDRRGRRSIARSHAVDIDSVARGGAMTDADAIAKLLAPVTLAEFTATLWERRARHIVRDDPSRFSDLVDLDEIERALLIGAFNRATLRLSREGSIAPRQYLSTRHYSPNKHLANELDTERVLDEFARGASLVLTFTETNFPRICALARTIAGVFNSCTEGHVIVTPTSASESALDLHYDIVDVFALQVRGRKRWKVYAPRFVAPLPHQRNFGVARTSADDLVLDVELGPGDTLYIPRGFPHFAERSEGVSIHVAIGVRPFTVYDAVSRAFDRALAEIAEDPALRRALFSPRLDAAADEDELAIAATRAGLERSLAHLEPEAGVARLHDDLRRQQYCMAAGRLAALADLDAMTLDSRVALGDRPLIRVLEGPGRLPACRIEANNHALLLPAKFEASLRQLCGAEGPVVVRTFAQLGEDDQLMLGKLLVRKGVGAWLDAPRA
ncbi:JmjC domain-containing protein [Nannocystaceae bacterium ST9]